MLGFKAPFIAALPAPFYLLLGRHWHAAFLVNIASMWVLFAALYRIARRWWSARAAVFAIAITARCRAHGLARWFMVGMPWPRWWRRDLRTHRVGRLKRTGTPCSSDLVRFRLPLKVSFRCCPARLVYVWFTSGAGCGRSSGWRCPACCWRSGMPASPAAGECTRCGFRAPAAIQGTGPIFDTHDRDKPFARGATGVSYYLLALLAG